MANVTCRYCGMPARLDEDVDGEWICPYCGAENYYCGSCHH